MSIMYYCVEAKHIAKVESAYTTPIDDTGMNPESGGRESPLSADDCGSSRAPLVVASRPFGDFSAATTITQNTVRTFISATNS